MRRFVARSLLLAALACASTGCATAVSLAEGPRAYTESDYDRVYRRWTRSENEFSWSHMTDVLHVTATFESWEFRWAYVVRYAHDYGFDANARDEMLQASLADSQQSHRFFVTLAGDKFRENNLTGAQSAWRVLLVDEEGRTVEPTEIERVRRPSPTEQGYFASVNSHRAVFRIVFPARSADGVPTIRPETRRVRLRFTGARGAVDLEWQVTPRTVATNDGR